MAKKKTVRPGASSNSEASEKRKLTWRQERFIEEYIHNGGNGTQAYLCAHPGVQVTSARTEAHRLLTKPYVVDAIAEERERLRGMLNFRREDALRIYLGMALATVDDFTQVLKKPSSKKSYTGLKEKKYAIKSATESFKNGNDIQLVDRKAAVDELWEKLGLGEETGGRDRLTFLEGLLGLSRKPRTESSGDK